MLRRREPSETIQRMIRVCSPTQRVSGTTSRQEREKKKTHLGGLSRSPAAGCCAAHKMYLCNAGLSHTESVCAAYPSHDQSRDSHPTRARTVVVDPLPVGGRIVYASTGTGVDVGDVAYSTDTDPHRLEQRKTPPDPPRITPIHQFIRPSSEPTQLALGTLHLHEPSQQPRIRDRRRPSRGGRRGEAEVGLDHDPRGEGAKGVAAVCFAERWTDVFEERSAFSARITVGSAVVGLRRRRKATFVRLTGRDEPRGAA